MKPTKWCISCKKVLARPGEFTCEACAERQERKGDAFRAPVFHLHVRVLEARREGEAWFALFEEPDGTTTWMEQPAEPSIGDEQVLYVIRAGSAECARLSELVESGAGPEQLEEFTHSTARRYGAWCEKTWDEARAAGGGQ